MKHKIIITLVFAFFTANIFSQTITRPVLTGAPFLRVSPDARAGGLGDQGVATSPDGFSQYWNASKYLFSRSYSGFSVSYTPFLSKLTNDVFLLNGTYHQYLNDEERSAIAASIYYFNLGEIELTSLVGNQIQSDGIAKPNEFAIDLSYGLMLSDSYSMSVTARYIRSDLYNNISDSDNSQTKAAGTFAVDLGGYMQTENFDGIGDMEGRIRGGFQVANIGPKLDYSDTNENSSFLPTNLRLGAGYDMMLDEYNTVSLTLETAKLLVPTPQEDGNIPNDGVFSGIFNSFSDAPDGFSEEFKEFTWSAGAEYNYNNQFMFRAGYFHESPEKGARQYVTVGAGLKFQSFGLDFSYLLTTSKINSALDNTLRFALTWDFGGDAAKSY